MNLSRKAIAEGLGTFVLVFFGCGTAIIAVNLWGGVDVVPTALAFGLVIVAMAYSIGNISGCHINPAVSIAMLINKKMTAKEFGVYVLSQFAGALLGAFALYGILKGAGYDFKMDGAIWGTNGVVGDAKASAYIASILFEVILTFVFVFTILFVTSKQEHAKIAGLVIGLSLVLVHLIGINFTGTSVNPARSFGPAFMRLVFGGGWSALKEVWVFIVAPLLGGAAAAYAFKFFKPEELPL